MQNGKNVSQERERGVVFKNNWMLVALFYTRGPEVNLKACHV